MSFFSRWSENTFLHLLKTDFKTIVGQPLMLISVSAPFLIIIILKLIFPLIYQLIFNVTGFDIGIYYSIVSVSFISLIPVSFGMVYAFFLHNERDSGILNIISVMPVRSRNFLYMRLSILWVLSFILLVLTCLITNPVHGEGWLRTIYVSFTFACQSQYVFLFIGKLARNKVERFAFVILYCILITTIPIGLIIHHPWNYFMFFSPLYWISWSWITSSAFESLIYGVIALTITYGSIGIFYYRLLGRS